MYSGNEPQSFAPGGITGFVQEHLQSSSTHPSGVQHSHQSTQIQPPGDVYTQPPSQGDMTHGLPNSNNQLSELTGYRGLGQTTMIVDNNKPPSFTDFGPGQRSSYNQDPNTSRGLGGNSYAHSATGQPPSVGAMGKVNVSQTADGHVDGYSKDGKAPGLSDVDRRGSSESGGSETVVLDVTGAQDFVGISLVGKNFRKFYPNAYYREEDDEEN